MPKFMDLTGRRFGKLTVIERLERKSEKNRWLCKCDCGKYATPTTYRLTHGQTSCGCDKTIYATHGMSKTRLYKTWLGMKKRCDNPNERCYERYGEKGVKVCEEWHDDFSAFAEWALSHGYADDLTIDRIDNSKGYSPDNCRWVTRDEQSRNRSSNILLTHNGKTMILAEWCRELGFDRWFVTQRYEQAKRKGKEIKFEELFTHRKYPAKKIAQYTQDGELVRIWDRVSEACKTGDFNKYGIYRCCNGETAQHKGFVWKYEKEE